VAAPPHDSGCRLAPYWRNIWYCETRLWPPSLPVCIPTEGQPRITRRHCRNTAPVWRKSGGAALDTCKSGIPVVGDVPVGYPPCQFYMTKNDLPEILAPYFTGLSRTSTHVDHIEPPHGGSHRGPEDRMEFRKYEAGANRDNSVQQVYSREAASVPRGPRGLIARQSGC
jgi:hypothetical protein